MRTVTGGRIAASIGVVALVAASCPAQADEFGSGTASDQQQLRQALELQSRRLETQQSALEEQERRLQEQRRELAETRRQLDSLRQRLNGTTDVRSGQVAQAGAAQPAPQPVGQAPASSNRPPAVAPLFEQPGVLTPRGKLVLEPSLQYSYSSNYRVSLVGYTIIPALVIGLIDIRNVDQSSFIAALTARYGLTNRLELEAKVPYVYRTQSTVSRPLGASSQFDSVFDASGSGVGDIELAARYQFNQPGSGGPFYIGGLRLKTRTGRSPFDVPYTSLPGAANAQFQASLPTGSGFYALQPSFTAIYPTDPAVFFGGVNYLYNFKRDVGKGFGTVDPGNAFGFNFGMGLALNDKTSISLGYEHTVVGKLTQNGVSPPGATTTQLGTLLLGYAYQLNPTTAVNLTLGAGLTQYAPAVQLTLRVPMTF